MISRHRRRDKSTSVEVRSLLRQKDSSLARKDSCLWQEIVCWLRSDKSYSMKLRNKLLRSFNLNLAKQPIAFVEQTFHFPQGLFAFAKQTKYIIKIRGCQMTSSYFYYVLSYSQLNT